MDGMVQIDLKTLMELSRKAEQRDVMLRFVVEQKYSIDKKELFNRCGEELPSTDKEEA